VNVLQKTLKFNFKLSYWLIVVLLLLMAVYVSFGRIFSPFLTEHKAEVEQFLSQQLQQPVSFGSIEGGWLGFSPVVRAADVSIGSGSQTLDVRQLYFQPDIIKSLLTRQWQLAAISVEGLQLTLEQNEQGNWLLLGTELAQQESTASDTAFNDLFQQFQRIGNLSVIDARLQVQPFATTPFFLASASITVQSRAGQQRLQARLVLPDEQALELSVQSAGLVSDWRVANADVYLKTPDTDWMQWLPRSWLPEAVSNFKFVGQFWLQVEQGVLTQAAIQLDEAQVEATYQEQATFLKLGAVTGYLTGDDQQRTLWFEQLPVGFAPEGPLFDWPLQINQQLVPENPLGIIELRAQRLDVQPITEFLTKYLESPVAQDVLSTLAFKGELQNTYVRWQSEAAWAERLKFDTNLDKIEFSPWHSVPGATGISGRIYGDLQQGELHLDSDGFSLNLADIFAQPWLYQQANARLTWSFDDQGFWLTSPYLKVRGDEGDLAGDFVIRLLTDPAAEDYMDLRVGMRDGDARYTERYLPRVLEQQHPELQQWLVRAIRQGKVNEGYFQWQGSINRGAPAHAHSITLFFDVEQAELDYQPNWPALTDASAQVFVHDWGVQVELDKGRVLSSDISQAHAEVIYAPKGSVTVLELSAELSSNVADGLYLVQRTPIAEQVPALKDWQGSGSVPVRFKLKVPFAKQSVQAQVSMQLENASLHMPSLDVRIEQLNGDVSFDTEQGATAKQISGRFLQQPFTASIAAKEMGSSKITQVLAQGKMPVKPLQDWLGQKQELPWQGVFDYQVFITLDEEDSQLVVESDLQGLSINLPEPLAKAAEQKIPTTWHMTLAGRERHYWLRHGQRFNLFAAQDSESQQLRAELSLGHQAARLPIESGLVVRGQLEQLALVEWLAFAERYTGKASGAPASLDILRKIQIKAKTVTGFAIPIENAQILYTPGKSASAWQAQISSQQITGKVQQVTPQQPLQVDIDTLYLPAFAEKTMDSFGQQLGQEPTAIPAMKISIAKLYSDEELLGRWDLNTEPSEHGVRFTDLQLGLKGLDVTGELDWRHKNKQTSTKFVGQLNGGNIARVMQAWGYSPSLSSESFKVDLDVRWLASPLEATLAGLAGKMRLSFRKGQLNTQDSGSKALRVFGLLNFDTVGRRLRLDFSDLLGKGLAYDSLKGHIAIQDGIYQTTEPFALKGVSSELDFEGQLDMNKGQVDASLLVAMPLTSNLPLAAVLVGAPAVGGALFIMERLVGDRLDRMAAVRYRVTGDWENPDISVVDKK